MSLKALPLLALLLCSTGAQALVISGQVSSQDNLYQTDWGHPWEDGVNTVGANAARAVTYQNNAFDFSGFNFLNISASGYVVDACDWSNDSSGNWEDYCKTDANGQQLIDDAYIRDLYWTADNLFRGNTVYSLIGIWSSAADFISPISPTFEIGTFLNLAVPQIEGSRYLFLAENDGLFADNKFSYDILITSDVPAPPVVALLLLGLMGMVLRRESVKS